MTKVGNPRDLRFFVLIAFIVVFVVNGALIGWGYYLAEQRPTVLLTGLQIEGSTDLCPGDRLSFRFTLTVTKPASIDLYTTVEHVSAGDNVSYTRLQRFELDKATEIEISRQWVLTPTYSDPATGNEIPWLPGSYIQRTSASVVGRSELSTVDVPFEIRSDCKAIGG